MILDEPDSYYFFIIGILYQQIKNQFYKKASSCVSISNLAKKKKVSFHAEL